MVNIAGSYDEQAEAQGEFEPIPAGDYRAKIIEASIEDVSPNDDKGRCLKLTWQIETGTHDGRLIWQRLNLWAKNFKSKKPNKTDAQVLQESISIANSQFAAIRQACGKPIVQDTDELLHIPCTIRVKLRNDPQYGASNEVGSVKPVAGAGPTQGGGAPQRFTPPANSAPQQSSNGWPKRNTA
ncbi:DUF669 domain-containing protein [Jiella avicenniae]|uniref:DUF669 domain-containing protein n=1 Tax=Jiella avicenniae TaxID=2907202 RepID=A0A9X1P369_9HYPH|nr:DUF669 domain-containing protein [Jiella avicenniae]MCE7028446.1 DUF669 domain-containing protein [Jiella avicenniae]